VLAPFELEAVVLALATVPVVIVLAFSAVIGIVMLAEPLKLVAVPVAPPEVAMVLAVCSTVAFAAVPVKLPVIMLATKLPEASRATIVLAPLAEAAVVLAFAKVPEETEVALSAVNNEPLAVITLAVKLPEASRATIVLAPFELEAVVLALATVPVVIAVPLRAVKPEPLPVTETNAPKLAAKLPLLSLATIVEAPFDAVAVVLALIKVPLVIFDALVVSVVAEAAKPDTLDAVIAMPTLEALVI
jgi:hypothetical protein